ncbi:MAG: T9SS type A sorting domain-containing protein [Parafilimonas sp.]
MKKFYSLCFAVFTICNVSFSQTGNLDSSFGKNGQVITDVSAQPDYLNSGALQPDGKIIAVGSSGYPLRNTLVRYKTNGHLDFSFGVNGISTFQIDAKSSEITAVALQQDGKIVATGYSGNTNHQSLSVLRFANNGSIDSSFGKKGVALIDVPKNNLVGTSIAVQPDGKIVVAGSLSRGSSSDPKIGIVIARFKSNGQPDSSFNNNGTKFLKPGLGCNAADITLLTDGKILVAGYSYKSYYDSIISFIVIKLTSDGQPDVSFGEKGIANARFHGQLFSIVNAIAVQKNGKIIVGGGLEDSYAAPTDFAIVQFTKNGTIDSSFGVNGVTRTILGGNDFVNSLVIQTDGKIIAAGESQVLGGGTRPAYFALVRYNANGKPDSTFGNNGKLTTSFENFSNRQYSYAKKVLLQPDEKIIALGDADIKQFNKSVFALARYLNEAGAKKSDAQNISIVNKIKISPNPANNFLQISGLDANAPTLLTITDRNGNVFKKLSVTSENYSCNISNLKNGFYYLVAENSNGKSAVFFIKQ